MTDKTIYQELQESSSAVTSLIEKAKKEEGDQLKQTVGDLQKAHEKNLENMKQLEKGRKSEPDLFVEDHEDIEIINKTTGHGQEAYRELQEINDRIYAFDTLMKLTKPHLMYDIRKARNKEIQGWLRKQARLCNQLKIRKSLNTSNSGEGNDWIPTNFSGAFFEFLRVPTSLAGLFTMLPMTSDTMKVPTISAGHTAYLVGETEFDDGAKFTTSKVTSANVTLAAKKMAIRTFYSGEMEEDSAVAIVPLVLDQIRKDLAEALENAMINGDTAATHGDTAVTSAADVRKAFLGLRQWAIDESNTTAFTGTPVIDDFRAFIQSMGKWGHGPSDVFCVTSPKGYQLMIRRFSDVTTVDKAGNKAVLIGNTLMAVDGYPIVVSGQYPATMNSSGVDTGAGTDTGITLCRKDAFIQGSWRDLKIETTRIASADQTEVVATQRHAFVMRYPTATDPVWNGYDFN